MNQYLRLVVAVASALAVGLVVGLVLGMSGKRQTQHDLDAAVRRAKDAEEALKRDSEECRGKVEEGRRSRELLLAKEHLLRSLVELFASNFGLASQHLGQARNRLKSAEAGLGKRELEKVKSLFDQIGGAQTLAMKLDPMARIQIEQILEELQKLPGGS
jgi:mannitol-specific phosphotransferase system IIBC component